MVLRQLIKLENVIVFRYHDAETPLYPRCEVFNGSSLDGRKDNVPIQKDNYMEILDHFDCEISLCPGEGEVFCLAPFIHFVRKPMRRMPSSASISRTKAENITLKIVSKSQNKEFEKTL